MLIAMDTYVFLNETSAEEAAALSAGFVAGWQKKRELDRMVVNPEDTRAKLLKAVENWKDENGAVS